MMIRYVRRLIAIMCMALPVQADNLVLPSEDSLKLNPYYPSNYIVKSGDTLWDIASLYLKDAWLWPELWHYNPQLEDPHLIYPGDRLVLQWIDGKPRVVRKQRSVNQHGEAVLSRALRITKSPVRAIDLSNLYKQLHKWQVLEKSLADSAPYVIQGEEGRSLTAVRNTIAVKGQLKGRQREYDIVRPGKTLRDPETLQLIGVEGKFVGQATFLDQTGSIARAVVTKSDQEVRSNDLLIPRKKVVLPEMLFPVPAPRNLGGVVISMNENAGIAGKGDLMVLNKGAQHGLAPGHLVSIYREGDSVKDPRSGDLTAMPRSKIAQALVVAVHDKFSRVVIIHSKQEVIIGDVTNSP